MQSETPTDLAYRSRDPHYDDDAQTATEAIYDDEATEPRTDRHE